MPNPRPTFHTPGHRYIHFRKAIAIHDFGVSMENITFFKRVAKRRANNKIAKASRRRNRARH